MNFSNLQLFHHPQLQLKPQDWRLEWKVYHHHPIIIITSQTPLLHSLNVMSNFTYTTCQSTSQPTLTQNPSQYHLLIFLTLSFLHSSSPQTVKLSTPIQMVIHQSIIQVISHGSSLPLLSSWSFVRFASYFFPRWNHSELASSHLHQLDDTRTWYLLCRSPPTQERSGNVVPIDGCLLGRSHSVVHLGLLTRLFT